MSSIVFDEIVGTLERNGWMRRGADLQGDVRVAELGFELRAADVRRAELRFRGD